MSFVVQAGMARELVPVNTQHQRWGLVRRVRRALGMLLVPVAYLGALIALPYVIGGTFLLLTTFAERFGREAYWTVVGGFTLGVLWLIWPVWRLMIRQLSDEIVDIDIMAVLISLVLGLLVMACVVGTRGIDPGPNILKGM